MQSHLNILVVGREPAILEVVKRLIDAHEGWTATTALTDSIAVEAFRSGHFPIVLVGAGVTEEEETALRQQLSAIDPLVAVIRHYGGGSGLLENEIYEHTSYHYQHASRVLS